MKKAKMPRDPAQRAKATLDLFLGERQPDPQPPAKNQAAVELGRLGGLKGGKARAERLSAEKRSEIAKRAAQARWERPPRA